MTRRRNPPQQRKDNESVASTTELMDMDITKLSEMEFRVTMVKMMCRLEKNINKSINKNIESLRVEMRVNLTEIKNAMNQGHLGGTAVKRLPSAQGVISALWDRAPHRALLL